MTWPSNSLFYRVKACDRQSKYEMRINAPRGLGGRRYLAISWGVIYAGKMQEVPRVFLVGAGPGDPELLTLKGLRLLRSADVVIYDRLISDAILDEVPPGASRIYVGKQGGTHSLPQQEISELLVGLGQENKCVVRLKGGDPFIFGRGGEEALALAEAGIPFEIVPGVTAASGIMGHLGLPLTHRGLANGVRFVTGQCGKGVALDLNWHSLADPETTLVVYMGLAKLREISAELLAAGMPGDLPAIAISKGTLEDEELCLGTLASLAEQVEAIALSPPVIIVFGRIVSLYSKLSGKGDV